METLNRMWTPEIGKSAFHPMGTFKLIQEAEHARIRQWQKEMTAGLEIAWKKVDVDGDNVLDPAELASVFEQLGETVDSEALMLQFDKDGDGKVDKDELFDWWCTLSVADRERLKGQAGPSAPRILHLKTKFKMAAMFAGNVSRDQAYNCTVGFAQLQRFSGGIGMPLNSKSNTSTHHQQHQLGKKVKHVEESLRATHATETAELRATAGKAEQRL
eukprot:COSAG05_NODE_1985_length_3744_cov_2.083676_1_plen_215_part_10